MCARWASPKSLAPGLLVERQLSSHESAGRIRGLAEAMVVLEEAVRAAVGAARDEEVSAVDIASALGVHRATVYRKYLSPAASEVKAGSRTRSVLGFVSEGRRAQSPPGGSGHGHNDPASAICLGTRRSDVMARRAGRGAFGSSPGR